MMRLSGFNVLACYSSDAEWEELRRVLDNNPKQRLEVYVRAPGDAGLSLIPDVQCTLHNKKGDVVYSFDFSKRVYRWRRDEIYLTRHEEVALYAHLQGFDAYWGAVVKTLRKKLGKSFMADEKELEFGYKICNR